MACASRGGGSGRQALTANLLPVRRDAIGVGTVLQISIGRLAVSSQTSRPCKKIRILQKPEIKREDRRQTVEHTIVRRWASSIAHLKPTCHQWAYSARVRKGLNEDVLATAY